MIIIGAGMAGCLAAVINPKAIIFEAAETAPDNHKAVLRFREDTVGKMTGISFKKVKVHKAIWLDGKEVAPTPRISNMYSRKVVGRYSDRSIWNMEASERFIAPPDFHMRMLEMVSDRIQYGTKVRSITDDKIHYNNKYMARAGCPIISTMPMGRLAASLSEEIKTEFTFKGIHTLRGKVKGCDIHQTIYFPDNGISIYRATLTGEDFILEGNREILLDEASSICEAFGIWCSHVEWEESQSSQKYGKIASIDERERRKFIAKATRKYNIYSLGRFGIWKNVLLDDVANDIYVIKKLIESDHYDKMKATM